AEKGGPRSLANTIVWLSGAHDPSRSVGGYRKAPSPAWPPEQALKATMRRATSPTPDIADERLRRPVEPKQFSSRCRTAFSWIDSPLQTEALQPGLNPSLMRSYT